jgi:hypothetical protein
MVQNSQIDLLNARLDAAKVERDAIDAEMAQLQHGDPDTPFRFFNLVGRRRLISERLLAAVEALGSAETFAPEVPLELDAEAYDVAPPARSRRGPDRTHQASLAVG